MSKLIRHLKIVAASLVVLAISLAIAIPLLIDPNHFKPALKQSIHSATGRVLDINGEIKLSLFPWLGFELGPSTLSNRQGFNQTKFALIDSAQIRLKLLPLLLGEIELRAIKLNTAHIYLQVDPHDQNNWDDMLTMPASTPLGQLAAPLIARLSINNAIIDYTNQLTGQHYQLHQLTFNSRSTGQDSLVEISLAAKFQANSPNTQGQLTLSTETDTSRLSRSQLSLPNTELKLTINSSGSGAHGQIKLLTDIQANPQLQRYAFHNTQITSQLQHPSLTTGQQAFSIETNIAIDLQREEASLSSLQFSSHHLQFSGELQLHRILSDAHFAAYFKLDPFDGQALMAQLGLTPLNASDPDAFKHIALQFKTQGNSQTVQLDDIHLQLDNSQITGSLATEITHQASRPQLQFNLHLDAINLDHYRAAQHAAHPSSSSSTKLSLITDLLSDLALDGQLSIDQLTLGGLHAEDIKLPIRARSGRIHINPATAALYGGQYRGDMRFDSRQTPSISINENFTNIDIGPLMQDLRGEAFITGTGSAKAQLNSQGQNIEELTASLNGELSINFKDGSLQNFNLPQLIRMAQRKHKQQTLSQTHSQPTHTDFDQLSANFQLENGIIRNQNLAATSAYLHLSGEGQADLIHQQIDYQLIGIVTAIRNDHSQDDIKPFQHQPLVIKLRGPLDQSNIEFELKKAPTTQAWQRLLPQNKQPKALTEKKVAPKKEELRREVEAKLGR